MATKKPARKRRATAKGRSSQRGAKRSTRHSAQAAQGLLIDVARSVGTTLGALAARSSQAAERLRAAAKKKRS